MRTAYQRTAGVLSLALIVGLTACGHPSNDTRSATEGMPDVLQQLTANPWILDFRASSLTTTPGAAITIRFDSQGTLSGATPCGSYRARFTLHESALRIRRIVGQREACAAGSSVVEQAYLTKLRLVDNVVPTGRDHLKLEGARDTRLAYNIHGLR